MPKSFFLHRYLFFSSLSCCALPPLAATQTTHQLVGNDRAAATRVAGYAQQLESQIPELWQALEKMKQQCWELEQRLEEILAPVDQPDRYAPHLGSSRDYLLKPNPTDGGNSATLLPPQVNWKQKDRSPCLEEAEEEEKEQEEKKNSGSNPPDNNSEEESTSNPLNTLKLVTRAKKMSSNKAATHYSNLAIKLISKHYCGARLTTKYPKNYQLLHSHCPNLSKNSSYILQQSWLRLDDKLTITLLEATSNQGQTLTLTPKEMNQLQLEEPDLFFSYSSFFSDIRQQALGSCFKTYYPSDKEEIKGILVGFHLSFKKKKPALSCLLLDQTDKESAGQQEALLRLFYPKPNPSSDKEEVGQIMIRLPLWGNPFLISEVVRSTPPPDRPRGSFYPIYLLNKNRQVALKRKLDNLTPTEIKKHREVKEHNIEIFKDPRNSNLCNNHPFALFLRGSRVIMIGKEPEENKLEKEPEKLQQPFIIKMDYPRLDYLPIDENSGEAFNIYLDVKNTEELNKPPTDKKKQKGEVIDTNSNSYQKELLECKGGWKEWVNQKTLKEVKKKDCADELLKKEWEDKEEKIKEDQLLENKPAPPLRNQPKNLKEASIIDMKNCKAYHTPYCSYYMSLYKNFCLLLPCTFYHKIGVLTRDGWHSGSLLQNFGKKRNAIDRNEDATYAPFVTSIIQMGSNPILFFKIEAGWLAYGDSNFQRQLTLFHDSDDQTMLLTVKQQDYLAIKADYGGISHLNNYGLHTDYHNSHYITLLNGGEQPHYTKEDRKRLEIYWDSYYTNPLDGTCYRKRDPYTKYLSRHVLNQLHQDLGGNKIKDGNESDEDGHLYD